MSVSGPGGTLLVISQVFPPDPAAVGQHIGDVAEAMVARGWRVVVYTAGRGYDDPTVRYPVRETWHGVDVRRLPLSSFGKGGIGVRLVAQMLFLAQALLRGVFTRRLTAILVSTSPPFAGFGGRILGWIRRAPVVWWAMDINPDQMVRSGRLRESSLVARVFDWMNRVTLRGARDVITLDRFMRETLLRKAAVEGKMHVIPPWAHDNVLEDVPHEANPFRHEHGLDDRFVVMYSGNHGYSTPLGTLLEAAKRLEHDRRIVFAFIGGGVVKKQIDEMVSLGRPPNILSLPYQPLENIRYSLSAADVHIVSIANEAVGVVHPCKIYGALAVGRPIIALAAKQSYAADIIASHDVGWVLQHGEVDRLTDLLRTIAGMPVDQRIALGMAAKQAAATEFSRSRLLARVCDVVEGTGA